MVFGDTPRTGGETTNDTSCWRMAKLLEKCGQHPTYNVQGQVRIRLLCTTTITTAIAVCLKTQNF